MQVVSKTVAGNAIPKANEGLSAVLLPGGRSLLFRDASNKYVISYSYDIMPQINTRVQSQCDFKANTCLGSLFLRRG